jgi:hypothetical protein
MSKELYEIQQERAMIDKARSQETTFYNRQAELNEIQFRPIEQPTARL